MSETARERFIRNTGEEIRIWRAMAVKLRREGDIEKAERIEKIAAQWEWIEQQAKGER